MVVDNAAGLVTGFVRFVGGLVTTFVTEAGAFNALTGVKDEIELAGGIAEIDISSLFPFPRICRRKALAWCRQPLFLGTAAGYE